MTRVALCARYSSDNQRDVSIDDQFRICRLDRASRYWRAYKNEHSRSWALGSVGIGGCGGQI